MQDEFYLKGSKNIYDHLPRIHSEVKDPCCMGVFLVFFLGFIGLAVWGSILFWQNGNFTIVETDSSAYFENVTYEKLRWFLIIVLSCLGGGFVVSLILLLGFNKFPKATINLICHVGNWFMCALCIFLLIYDSNKSTAMVE